MSEPAGSECDGHCLNFCRLLSEVRNPQTIASGAGVRERHLLRRQFGGDRWRKMKGEATIELFDGRVREAEVHWYEAQGVGRRKMKYKHFL